MASPVPQSTTQKSNRLEQLDLSKYFITGTFAKITNFTPCYVYAWQIMALSAA
jgi:hypothetical protein